MRMPWQAYACQTKGEVLQSVLSPRERLRGATQLHQVRGHRRGVLMGRLLLLDVLPKNVNRRTPAA